MAGFEWNGRSGKSKNKLKNRNAYYKHDFDYVARFDRTGGSGKFSKYDYYNPDFVYATGSKRTWHSGTSRTFNNRNAYYNDDLNYASCTIISHDRFMVCSGYDPKLVAFYHMIPGRKYDPNLKIWTFPLVFYHLVVSQLQAFQMSVFQMPSKLMDQVKSSSAVTGSFENCDNYQKSFYENSEEDEELSSFIFEAAEPPLSSSEICIRCALSDGVNIDNHKCNVVDLLNLEDKNSLCKDESNLCIKLEIESLFDEDESWFDDFQKSCNENDIDKVQKNFYDDCDDDVFATVNLD